MTKVILDLNKLPHATLSTVTYAGLYVGLTRVRKGVDVAILPPLPSTESTYASDSAAAAASDSGRLPGIHATERTPDLRYLMNLRPPVDLLAWIGGFNADGKWSRGDARRYIAAVSKRSKKRK